MGFLNKVKPDEPRRVFPKKYKRAGSVTDAEKELIAQFVQDQPAEIRPAQVAALAKLTRRSREVIKDLIEEAKENFVAKVGRYAEIHLQATEDALASDTVAGLEVATKASQWALENISFEGARVVEKAKVESSGTKIMIGVRLGGANDTPTTAIAVETHE